MLQFSLLESSQQTQLTQLMAQTFTDSEGQEAEQMIGQLVEQLLSNTPESDKYAYAAMRENELIAGVIFSRVRCSEQGRELFILSPMATKTAYQGKGIGQQLINYAIEHLKQIGVDTLLTYGDPNFYSKVGFIAIDEALISAPFTLSFPHGWLAQSLNAKPIEQISSPIQCVAALMDEKYW